MAGYMYLGKKKVCPAVLVGTGTSSCVDIWDVDSNGALKFKSSISFPGVVSIDIDILYCAQGQSVFAYNTDIEEVEFQDLETIGTRALFTMFVGSSVTTASFPKLKQIGQYGMYRMFMQSSLESVNFDSLETIDSFGAAQCFDGTSIDGELEFPKLKTVNRYGLTVSFSGTDVTKAKFPLLDSCSTAALSYCFSGCTSLTDIYFNSLKTTSFLSTDCFDSIVSSVTGCTLHFPSNLSSVVSTLTGYPNFGGTNTVIFYDLPETT